MHQPVLALESTEDMVWEGRCFAMTKTLKELTTIQSTHPSGPSEYLLSCLDKDLNQLMCDPLPAQRPRCFSEQAFPASPGRCTAEYWTGVL